MLLHLTVKPNSKADSIQKDGTGNITVKIRAQPVDGKANKYLVEYLSEIFKIPKSKIEIIKGETGKHKTVELAADENYIRNILENYK